MTDEQRTEISRKAFELARSHGRNADKYAAKLAEEALAEGMIEESEFWRRVEAALKPRGASD
jgi:hypothetical protein